jgi:uncharacterized DUF497 family protein
VTTSVVGDFEWDDAKAAANLAKHGVSFKEAVSAMLDPDAVILGDPLHTDRFALIGASTSGRVLYVVHIERGVRDRIISARRATKAEEITYAKRVTP